MKLKERIELMLQLGEQLQQPSPAMEEAMEQVLQKTYYNNLWFTVENQRQAIQAIAEQFLNPANLEKWLSAYTIPEDTTPSTVGLIMAGNIPLVGFHDLLCVFLAGHRAKIKLSDKDPYWIPYLISCCESINDASKAYFACTERLSGFDAIIATGSNNSARYFETYFGKYPNIIRQNRNAVAVLDGTESETDLFHLGKDVFQYFGLGCRNVSKLYVPRGYVFEPLLEGLYNYNAVVMHDKYKNNFDYHYAIYIINRLVFIANGCILMRENEAIASPIANLYYEYYNDLDEVHQKLSQRVNELQIVVSNHTFPSLPNIGFGATQNPQLWDYADGADTMNFLLSL